MPLSANSLFHFTDGKDTLKQILEDDLRVSYSKESVILGGGGGVEIYIPMVSFCDIPLSAIKDHISKYGSYAIGLTKEWGVKKRLNPVLYTAQTSMLSESFRKALIHFCGKASFDSLSNEQKSLLDVLRYIKNYEGDYLRKGETKRNYRYADEREWRYVPPFDKDIRMLISAMGSEELEEKRIAAIQSLEDLRLDFEPNDIKYIIIDNDTEIGEFIEHLKRAKGKKYSYHDVERLTTRILTSEQIRDDM